MNKNKPTILITMSNADDARLASITGDISIIFSDRATADAIVRFGGQPVYAPSLYALSEHELNDYLDFADGILLTGADTNVNPLHYGEELGGFDGRIDDERDQMDILLVRRAYERKIPLLGICKGMQIMNVALGGTLYQDVASQQPSMVAHGQRGKRHEVTHSAILARGSLLRGLARSDAIELKGGHQQAVKQLAPGLSCAAIADDGVVEAYEAHGYPFLMGIQFHAELRLDEPFCQAIFESFIRSTGGKKT